MSSEEELPQGFSGVTARQMQPEAGGLLAHPAADLEQPQAQGSESERSGAALAQPAAEGIEQPVGGGMQQAELVGPEAVATELVGEAGALDVVDPLLGRAALDIPIVERQRRIRAGRDDKADVGPLLERLGLEDGPARRGPGAGGVGGFAGQADLRAGLFGLLLGPFAQRLGQIRQPGIGGQAQSVGDPFGLASVIEGGHGEAAVGARRAVRSAHRASAPAGARPAA